jgi:rubrerythrin
VRLSDSPTVKRILAHERAHAAAVEEAIRELGGTPAAPRPIARAAVVRSFGAWRTEAIERENHWSAGYAALIPKLANPRLRSTFGALMTTEAEHAVALDIA